MKKVFCLAWFRCRTFHKPNLIQIFRLKLVRPAELIQKLILIPSDLNLEGEKMLISVKLLTNLHCIRFGTWKARRLNQRRSKVKIPGQARQKEQLSSSKLKQVFLIDSDAELSVYLIQFIRCSAHEKYGVWTGRPLVSFGHAAGIIRRITQS